MAVPFNTSDTKKKSKGKSKDNGGGNNGQNKIIPHISLQMLLRILFERSAKNQRFVQKKCNNKL